MSISPIQNTQSFPVARRPAASEAIKHVAFGCLKDFAVSLAAGAAVALFIPTPAGVTLLVAAIAVQSAVSVFFQSLGGFAAYKAAQGGSNQARLEQVVSFCEMITGANFAIFTGLNAQTLVHEVGHVLAISAVYQKPRARIELLPFVGGQTRYLKSPLSSFGQKLGVAGSTLFLVASGPLFTLLISSVIFAIGLAMKEKYPVFGKYLMAWGLLDFFNHAYYAYSAVWTPLSYLTHDFVHLALFGLNPIAAAVGIAAIPLIIALGVHCWKHQHRDLRTVG